MEYTQELDRRAKRIGRLMLWWLVYCLFELVFGWGNQRHSPIFFALGPYWFCLHGEPIGWLFIAVLLPCVLAFPIRWVLRAAWPPAPLTERELTWNVLTFILSAVAFLFWCVLAAAGISIGA